MSKSSSKSKGKGTKIVKQNLIRIVLVSAAAIAGFAVTIPEKLPPGQARDQVEQMKQKLTTIAGPSGEQIGEKIKTIANQAQAYVLRALKTAQIPKRLTGKDEIVVEDVVQNFTQELKDLPKEKAKQIKTQFCQDVINEATGSAAQ